MGKSLGRGVHGTDVLLAVIFGLTTIDLSFRLAGRPVGIGDLILIPVFLIVILSPDSGRLPAGYIISTLMYLAWCVMTLGWTADLSAALGPVIQYVAFFLLVPLVFCRVRTMAGLSLVIRVYLVCATFVGIAVLGYATATGTFSYVYFLNYQKNYLGAVMGNAIPLLLAMLVVTGKRRWLVQIALGVCGMTLIMSSSRGSWLGAIVGVVVFLILSKRVKQGAAMGALGLGAYWVYFKFIAPEAGESLLDFSESSSAYSRLTIYQEAERFIAQSPWVGQGPGSFVVRIPSIGFEQSDPSNVFLLNLAEFGVVGLVLFLAIGLFVVQAAIRNAIMLNGDPRLRVLSAGLAGAAMSHFAHIQIDVSWVRGTGTFFFACIGMMMKLPALVPAVASTRGECERD